LRHDQMADALRGLNLRCFSLCANLWIITEVKNIEL
jgi:hypothetical protein